MEYRILGKTGLKVSALSLGTVSLGVDYGIARPGDFGKPTEADAVRLVQEALDAGITLFDTAPTYGDSERLLGRILSPEARVATKVTIPRDITGRQLNDRIRQSIEKSRKRLQRDSLDILQIHNATAEMFQDRALTDALLEARRQGRVRFLGASVYSAEAARTVIQNPDFSVLQVAYSLLDQRMADEILTLARRRQVGLLVRSALLKGALSEKALWLPSELQLLKKAVDRSRRVLGCSWNSLSEQALRFCLSSADVDSVLIGARTSEELQQAVRAAQSGALPPALLQRTGTLKLDHEQMLNPSFWPIP